MASSTNRSSFAVDEDLWFGDGDDAEAESRAAASLAAVGARIVGAKPFPVAARRLDELTRNPNARIEQVVGVLESDPALSARLLRLVNSAGYGLKVRCTSVRHAAVLVGSRRLNQVATTAAILDLFDSNNAKALDLLEHAAVVGSLCRYLAVHVGLPHDEMFTCGFLHDIGKLMLLDAERERYVEILDQFGGVPDQMHLAERRVFGFDHAVLGAHVLAAWNIPEPVPKVIAWHHAPARAMQDTVVAAMVETLRLGDLLAYVLATHDERAGVDLVCSSSSAQYLDISEAQLGAMWQDLAALRARSRARSQGGDAELDSFVPNLDAPESLRPRARGSLRPRSAVSGAALGVSGEAAPRPLQEVPTQFPCSVCAKPSYGNVCPACGGHVCPEHQVSDNEWCTMCRREFGQFRRSGRLSWPVKITGLFLVGGTLSVSLVSAGTVPDASLANWLVGPALVVALWAVVLPIAHNLWQKLRFLQKRRELMVGGLPITAPSPVIITSLPPGTLGSLTMSAAPVARGRGSYDDEPALSIAPLSTPPLSMGPLSLRPSSLVQPPSPRLAVTPTAATSRSSLTPRVSLAPVAAHPSVQVQESVRASVRPLAIALPTEPPPIVAEEATRPSLLAPPPERPAPELLLRGSMRVVESMAPSEHPARASGNEASQLPSDPVAPPERLEAEETRAAISESGPLPVLPWRGPAAPVNSRLHRHAAVTCSAVVLNSCSSYETGADDRISALEVSVARAAS